jgi:branched-chain amino acid transport system permease protein
MRFIFKTDYVQDIRLMKHGGQRFWYGLLVAALIVLPWIASNYLIDQLVLIFIYSIVGLGLMLLSGYTGLISLGHAAFLGVGAYTEAVLAAKGWPFPLSVAMAILLSAITGVIVGLPALRVKGIYLAIATLALGVIVEEVLTRWESVTGGNSGLSVKAVQLFGIKIASLQGFYYLSFAFVVAATWLVLNLLRSPTGRAFVAVRDSEISAQSMGIHLAKYKTISFALSAALTGLAGALYAHKIRFLSPEQFTVLQSIELLMMIFIGGIGSIHGVFFGAFFLIVLPQAISVAKDFLPAAIGGAAGLQATIFGLIIIGFVMFEPLGIYGRWVKIRTYLQMFPFYRKGAFKRQKTFQKSERNR